MKEGGDVGEIGGMRQRRSAGEIEELVEGYRKSGLGRSEYCRQVGVAVHILSYYLRRQLFEAFGWQCIDRPRCRLLSNGHTRRSCISENAGREPAPLDAYGLPDARVSMDFRVWRGHRGASRRVNISVTMSNVGL